MRWLSLWPTLTRPLNPLTRQPHPPNPHRNDPDFVEVGIGEFRLKPTQLSIDMNRAHLSLWAIASAPLILGMHPGDMTPTVVEMVTNPAVIAINQQWCCGNAGVCEYM